MLSCTALLPFLAIVDDHKVTESLGGRAAQSFAQGGDENAACAHRSGSTPVYLGSIMHPNDGCGRETVYGLKFAWRELPQANEEP
jgi:hypothetical protein